MLLRKTRGVDFALPDLGEISTDLIPASDSRTSLVPFSLLPSTRLYSLAEPHDADPPN